MTTDGDAQYVAPEKGRKGGQRFRKQERLLPDVIIKKADSSTYGSGSPTMPRIKERDPLTEAAMKIGAGPEILGNKVYMENLRGKVETSHRLDTINARVKDAVRSFEEGEDDLTRELLDNQNIQTETIPTIKGIMENSKGKVINLMVEHDRFNQDRDVVLGDLKTWFETSTDDPVFSMAGNKSKEDENEVNQAVQNLQELMEEQQDSKRRLDHIVVGMVDFCNQALEFQRTIEESREIHSSKEEEGDDPLSGLDDVVARAQGLVDMFQVNAIGVRTEVAVDTVEKLLRLMDAAKEKVEKKEEEFNKAITMVEQKNREAVALIRQADTMKDKIMKEQKHASDLEGILKNTRSQMQKMTQTIAEKEREIQQLNDEVEELAAGEAVIAVQDELKKVSDMRDSLMARVATFDEEQEAFKEKFYGMMKDMEEDFNTQMMAKDKDLEQMEEVDANRVAEIEKINTQIDELEGKEIEYKYQIDSLTKELDETKKNGISLEQHQSEMKDTEERWKKKLLEVNEKQLKDQRDAKANLRGQLEQERKEITERVQKEMQELWAGQVTKAEEALKTRNKEYEELALLEKKQAQMVADLEKRLETSTEALKAAEEDLAAATERADKAEADAEAAVADSTEKAKLLLEAEGYQPSNTARPTVEIHEPEAPEEEANDNADEPEMFEPENMASMSPTSSAGKPEAASPLMRHPSRSRTRSSKMTRTPRTGGGRRTYVDMGWGCSRLLTAHNSETPVKLSDDPKALSRDQLMELLKAPASAEEIKLRQQDLKGEDSPADNQLREYAFMVFAEALDKEVATMADMRERHSIGRMDGLLTYANCLEMMGDSAQAERIYKKTMNRRNQAELKNVSDHTRSVSLQCYAHVLQSQYQLKEAEAKYRDALMLEPDNSRTLVLFAQGLMDMDKLKEADTYVHRAVTSNSRNPDAWYLQGKIKQKMGDLNMAEFSFRQCLEILPNHVLARSALATILAQKGDSDAGAGLMSDVNALTAEALGAKAVLMVYQGKQDEAKDMYRQAHELNAADVEVTKEYAAIASIDSIDDAERILQESIHHLQRIEEEGSQDEGGESNKWAKVKSVQLVIAFIQMLLTRNAFARALEMAERFISENTGVESSFMKHAAATACYFLERYDDAAGYLMELREDNPHSLKDIVLLKNVRIKQERQDEAYELLEEALDIFRGDEIELDKDEDMSMFVGICHELASHYVSEGRFDEADATYNAALTKSPNSKATYLAMGNMFRLTHRATQAIKAYYDALEIDPDYLFAINNVALAHHENGDGEEAMKQYKRGLKVVMDSAEPPPKGDFLLINYATFLHETEDITRASLVLRKAMSKYPASEEVTLNLSIILISQDGPKPVLAMMEKRRENGLATAGCNIALGMHFANELQFSEAIQKLEEALVERPDLGEAHCLLAELHRADNNEEASLEAYGAVLTLNEAPAWGYNNCGVAMKHQGNVADARSMFRLARNAAPSDLTYITNVALSEEEDAVVLSQLEVAAKVEGNCREVLEEIKRRLESEGLEEQAAVVAAQIEGIPKENEVLVLGDGDLGMKRVPHDFGVKVRGYISESTIVGNAVSSISQLEMAIRDKEATEKRKQVMNKHARKKARAASKVIRESSGAAGSDGVAVPVNVEDTLLEESDSDDEFEANLPEHLKQLLDGAGSDLLMVREVLLEEVLRLADKEAEYEEALREARANAEKLEADLLEEQSKPKSEGNGDVSRLQLVIDEMVTPNKDREEHKKFDAILDKWIEGDRPSLIKAAVDVYSRWRTAEVVIEKEQKKASSLQNRVVELEEAAKECKECVEKDSEIDALREEVDELNHKINSELADEITSLREQLEMAAEAVEELEEQQGSSNNSERASSPTKSSREGTPAKKSRGFLDRLDPSKEWFRPKVVGDKTGRPDTSGSGSHDNSDGTATPIRGSRAAMAEENKKLRLQLDKAVQRHKTAMERIDSLEKECILLRGVNGDVAQLHDKNKELHDRIIELVQEMALLKIQLDPTKYKRLSLLQYDGMVEREKTMEKRLAELEPLVAELTEDNEKKTKTIDELQSHILEQKEKYENQIADLRLNVKKLESKVEDLKKKIRELNFEIERLKRKHEREIKELHRKYEKLIEKMKGEMKREALRLHGRIVLFYKEVFSLFTLVEGQVGQYFPEDVTTAEYNDIVTGDIQVLVDTFLFLRNLKKKMDEYEKKMSTKLTNIDTEIHKMSGRGDYVLMEQKELLDKISEQERKLQETQEEIANSIKQRRAAAKERKRRKRTASAGEASNTGGLEGSDAGPRAHSTTPYDLFAGGDALEKLGDGSKPKSRQSTRGSSRPTSRTDSITDSRASSREGEHKKSVNFSTPSETEIVTRKKRHLALQDRLKQAFGESPVSPDRVGLPPLKQPPAQAQPGTHGHDRSTGGAEALAAARAKSRNEAKAIIQRMEEKNSALSERNENISEDVASQKVRQTPQYHSPSGRSSPDGRHHVRSRREQSFREVVYGDQATLHPSPRPRNRSQSPTSPSRQLSPSTRMAVADDAADLFNDENQQMGASDMIEGFRTASRQAQAHATPGSGGDVRVWTTSTNAQSMFEPNPSSSSKVGFAPGPVLQIRDDSPAGFMSTQEIRSSLNMTASSKKTSMKKPRVSGIRDKLPSNADPVPLELASKRVV